MEGEEKREVRNYTPPLLENSNFGEEIVCHRPMRNGHPNMSIEEKDGKTIVHNYGHGGSGWTLGPGSSEYVVNLFLDKYPNTWKREPITIIGTGALGLFTAWYLGEKGFTNITILTKADAGQTSYNAGGLLAPVSMNNEGEEIQKLINDIGVSAYHFYRSIANGKFKEFKGGAFMTTAYFENREDSGLEPYVQAEVMRPAKDVTLDFGNGTKRDMVAYDDGIFISPYDMMKALNHYVTTCGAAIREEEVANFSKIKDSIIFKCSGMGAASLNNDPEMVSVQGHLLKLTNQDLKSFSRGMILVYYPESVLNKHGQEVTRSLYLFPKEFPGSQKNDIGVLGGTFILGATKETPNEEEFEIIKHNARKFFGWQPKEI